MSRLGKYKKYFECHSEIQDTFRQDGIKYLVMSCIHGGDYIVASLDICESIDSTIATVDGLDLHVVKVKNILSDFKGIPCLGFFIEVYEYYKFILDLSECDLSNIIDMRITPRINSYGNRIYKIIYPSGSNKLSPVRAEGVISCVKYKEAMKSIDFSDLCYADDFLKGSKIKSFNFNDIDTRELISIVGFFEDCKELKRVDGSIKSRGLLNVSAMFSGCSSLEVLDENIFSGCRINKLDSVFNGCELLRNKPLHGNNIRGMSEGPKLVFSFSNANDSESMFELMYNALGSMSESPFKGVSGVFRAGVANIDMYNIVGIFNESNFSIIDLSKVHFNYTLPSILCIFSTRNSIDYYNDVYDDYDCYDDNWDGYIYAVMQNLSAKADYEVNLRKFPGLPNVLVVNSSVKIHPKDSIMFEIINIGTDTESIETKVNLIKMFGCQKKVLAVCG